jgi:hypothetical protein
MFAMFPFALINPVGRISPFQGYVGRVLFFKILTSLRDLKTTDVFVKNDDLMQQEAYIYFLMDILII